MPGDGPEVLWHSIRVDGLFAVYCFGGIETTMAALWLECFRPNLNSTASAVLRLLNSAICRKAL